MNDNNSICCDFCNMKIDFVHHLTNINDINIDYLQELLKDHKIVSNLSNIMSKNVKKLLEREIMISRHVLFHQKYVAKQTKESIESLPFESSSNNIMITEKVFVPVHLNPTYNFIGRILGPGGLTLKQIEKQFDCNIKIRGKGSVRNISKENISRTRSNTNHQEDDLHMIITATGEEHSARNKIKSVEKYLKLLFDEAVSKSINEDEAKQNQLMEYAIVKGTYRDMSFRHNKRPNKESNTDFPLTDFKRQIFQSPYFTAPLVTAPMSSLLFLNQVSPQMTPSILPNFGYPCKIGMFNMK